MTMMPGRRSLLLLTTALFATGGAVAHAQPAAERATALVKGVGDKLVAVVNGPGSTAQKRKALTQVIDGAVDVNSVARFCLGRFWNQASPDQQKRYTVLFHDVLVTNITAKVGEYEGVRFTMARTVPDGDNVKVGTVVNRPNNPPTDVQWLISNPGGDPKIIDVIAEGTSLRLTQRSDYASFLGHNGGNIDALINAMHQQVQQNQATG